MRRIGQQTRKPGVNQWSIRQRSFLLFSEGMLGEEVSTSLKAKLNTVERYYLEWRKLPHTNLN